jgi:hypothetical protein
MRGPPPSPLCVMSLAPTHLWVQVVLQEVVGAGAPVAGGARQPLLLVGAVDRPVAELPGVAAARVLACGSQGGGGEGSKRAGRGSLSAGLHAKTSACAALQAVRWLFGSCSFASDRPEYTCVPGWAKGHCVQGCGRRCLQFLICEAGVFWRSVGGRRQAGGGGGDGGRVSPTRSDPSWAPPAPDLVCGEVELAAVARGGLLPRCLGSGGHYRCIIGGVGAASWLFRHDLLPPWCGSSHFYSSTPYLGPIVCGKGPPELWDGQVKINLIALRLQSGTISLV